MDMPKMNDAQQRAFWGWWGNKDVTFTQEDIRCLLERVKEFNAGAIDQYLTEHVDRVYEAWLAERGVESPPKEAMDHGGN